MVPSPSPAWNSSPRCAPDLRGAHRSWLVIGAYSAAGDSTDDPRPRIITQKMPGDVARRLYEARDAGATQAQQEAILAEALGEHYFKDGGRRARGLDVELNDVAWMDVEL
ncbi:hypothetical protein ACIOGZ_12245 [Kitasatospora sp. NPDC088160]|uniref:hypothetical protein n=1 Tax=Kitasatospora sp. NPDC088160 TaxID=3364072 RepID=UPI00381B51D5